MCSSKLFCQGVHGRSAADGVVQRHVNAVSVAFLHKHGVERNEGVFPFGLLYAIHIRLTHRHETLLVSEGDIVVIVVIQRGTREPCFEMLLLNHRLCDVHAGIGVPPEETGEGEEPDSVDEDGPRIQHGVRRYGAAREL